MIQRSRVGAALASTVLACTVAATACATTNRLATGPLVPEGTPRRTPQPGEYDRVFISCGTALYPEPLFVGRVVRRAQSGELVPLIGVTVLLETHGTVHATPTTTPIAIEQDSNGRFTYRLTLSSDTFVYYNGDVAVGWEHVDDVATVTLQAAGCEPLRVEFTDPGQEKTLEMHCVGDAEKKPS